MLIVLSPAKTLDLSPQERHAGTKPLFHAQANKLARQLRALGPAKLAKLMNTSAKLAGEVDAYYADWKAKFDARGAKEAIYAFRGDVYQGLAVDDFTRGDLDFAQQHLRILSGLYGVLRPLDLMQAYRLEMGTPLRTDAGRDLYAWWGDSIARALGRELDEQRERVVVNLASEEYFAAARPERLKARVIAPAFRELHDGQYRFLSFYGKKARGMMARHLVKSRGDDPAAILKFREGGYRYHRELSTDDEPVFTREKPAV
jgi:cytoplasmic iron level regulating protein YaaA (DUF328/UPF0246 family)